MSPVFELLNRAAPRADFDHRRYDLAQLALQLVDYIVQNQASLEGSVSPAEVIDHLTQAARRMYPADLGRPWSKVARTVFASVLNDGRPHEAVWLEPNSVDGDAARPEDFRFRLLRLVDGEAGAAVVATDEAILLYLQALNVDLADRALALKLMVEIQMQAGEFDKALESARQATRTARGLSASLRERLADTRRDIGAVDWHGEMPEWLKEVQAQISQQIERDRQLLELSTHASGDPDAADACKRITEEVRVGADVWTRLERHLLQAIPVFLEAQKTQRFVPRGLAAVIDLSRDLFQPALTAAEEKFDALAECLIGGVAPPVIPAWWGLGDLCDVLLRAPVHYDRRDPEIDEPGDLGQPLGGSIPDDVAACAAEVLNMAAARPARLSELLQAARSRSGDVSDELRLLDVLWGAALWAFVTGMDGSADERPQSVDLAAAVAALTAVDNGVPLTDERFHGPDLLLATSLALDEIDLAAARVS